MTQNASSGLSDDRPNIVLVTIDSLRADHCGFLSDTGESLTPTLDRLANDGVAFSNAIAAGPRTPSSMPAVFTGQIDRTGDFDINDWSHWQYRYQHIERQMRRYRTLAENLRDRGYSTIGVTANPWTQDTGFDTGFDSYVEIDGEDVNRSNAPLLSLAGWTLSRTGVFAQNWKNSQEWFLQWPHYYQRIADAISNASEPYFLWVFILDTHQPYIAPRQFRSESSGPGMLYANYRESSSDGSDLSAHVTKGLERAYRDTVRSADAFVDRLHDECADDDPLFIVHSDHGESFGERGKYGHPPELYEENIRVPLVFHGMDREKTIHEPFSLRRIPETVTSILDDSRRELEDQASEYVLASTEDGKKATVRGSRWKLIRADDDEHLYDLEEDPEERTDVIDQRPEIADDLRATLRRRKQHNHEIVSIAQAITDWGQSRLSEGPRL